MDKLECPNCGSNLLDKESCPVYTDRRIHYEYGNNEFSIYEDDEYIDKLEYFCSWCDADITEVLKRNEIKISNYM